QVAGAAALLYGSGLTDPLVVKAILLDSTTLGRATPASAMNTQSTWLPDWGWGELNLDGAYQERTNFQADSVGAQDVRFYRATVNTGDRATLVWNRRVVGAPNQTAPPQALTLSNLDLYEYASSAQTQQASSTSPIDNVEQVRGTGSGTVIYKVKNASSTVDGLSGEPFALAARNGLTPLAAPKPTVALSVDKAAVHQGDAVTVTETVRNLSADMSGASATASLTLPAGVTVTSGGSTTWSPGGGTLATGATVSHQWTINGSADGSYHLVASAQDAAYGETFNSPQTTATLNVDSSPPRPAIACSHSSATDSKLAVSWSASDASPVTSYDVDASADGAGYTPWLSATAQTAATYSGQPGHSYAFRLRARDELANVSEYASCGALTVGFALVPPAPPTLSPPAKVLPAPAHLKLASVRRHKGRLSIDGRLAQGATGWVTCTYSARGQRALHTRARVRRGRYHLTLRLRRKQVHRGLLRIHYSGDHSFAPQRISKRLK
ncbi:MAG TPA: hypothetical protein VGI67_05200, partial [Thermoleophilaceae bacterium]